MIRWYSPEDRRSLCFKMLSNYFSYYESLEVIEIDSCVVCRDENYTLKIYPEPYNKPSFHIWYKYEWRVVVSFDEFVVLQTTNCECEKGKYLPKKITNDVLKLLNETKDGLEVSNWNFLIWLWNVNNYLSEQIDINKEIPKVEE